MKAQGGGYLVDIGRGLEGEGQLHAHPPALVKQFDKLVGDDSGELINVDTHRKLGRVGGLVGIVGGVGEITQEGFAQGPGDVGVAQHGKPDIDASAGLP